jgi:mono/diheme cytochrome c family protein
MNLIFRLVSLLFVVLLVFSGAGCYYDKEEELYPGTANCDTTATSAYATTVVPIISANCYNCHSGAATLGAGIQLNTYTALKIRVNDGTLLKAINHEAGASPMPKNGNKLSACNIAKIRRWINTGAPNN